MTSVLETLLQRGMIEQISNKEELIKELQRGVVPIYIGFDPTATSLHVGHLLPVMVLCHLQRAGYKPIILVGGATGMIGDPSGRSTERKLLSAEDIEQNVRAIKKQLGKFFTFEGTNAAVMVNNNDWLKELSIIEWLREIGKYFSINYMLSKESVKRRLEDKERETGLSYTEFSYMLMQAYDFLHLYDNHKCMIQGGGNDQWGNITAGIDLVRKLRQTEVFGITFPLVTTSNGEKFGKSAGNAFWIDSELTSPYKFYQYWLNSTDDDVEKMLKYFTFLELDNIEQIISEHRQDPSKRLAQKILSSEITKIIHGEEALQKVIKASNVLFGGEIKDLTIDQVLEIFDDVPKRELDKTAISNGINVIELLTKINLCASKREARDLVSGGGVYINNEKCANINYTITLESAISERLLVIRIGKKNYCLINLI
ncbi:MAG: tyrosine--tRNA ligase [Ignavibacteriaceae bacterium]|nr:tyrosine--tRNA ligase [Ignavibacteriaceae bacterium]